MSDHFQRDWVRRMRERRNVVNAIIPTANESNPQKEKGIESSSPSGQQQPLHHTFEVRKKPRKPGELSDEDSKDVKEYFGVSDGVSVVDERDFTYDEGGWH